MYNTRTNHEIDYKIYGEEMQYVEIELDPSETAVAEPVALCLWTMGSKWKPSSVTDPGKPQEVYSES
jgi:hypothetical protein